MKTTKIIGIATLVLIGVGLLPVTRDELRWRLASQCASSDLWKLADHCSTADAE